MGVIELNEANFFIGGRRKKILNINIGGIMMVLFKMNGCAGCSQAEPVFRNLSNQEGRVKFGILNISYANSVADMSFESTTPINVVPFILVFNNGAPLAKYKGIKNDMNSLRRFINDIYNIATEKNSTTYSSKPTKRNEGMYSKGYQNQTNEGQKYYVPSVESKFKRKTGYSPAYGEDEFEDEGGHLLIPDAITPHNTPWEGKYKAMDELSNYD